MSLSVGTRVGSYEIIAPLGAGGMGEVYLARDTKLGRDVAIKVLRESLANDSERLARFRREAQVLAALNHPNIAHIHGLEDSTGVPALVMELVDGPTLADRIARGPIPIDEALPIARQISDALEAAHEQGIIHRDLKPVNIKVREDGIVKVLDFGLAKALDPTEPASANAMNSPTLSVHATQAGIILGTAAYMSPEQARGKIVDRRTDIWAFGCVLYEMLTGARAFVGDDVTDTMAFVITKDPEWAALPSTTPESIRRLLRRSLEKDRTRRLAHIADARLEIAEGAAPDATAAPLVSHPWPTPAFSAATIVASLLVGGAVGWTLRKTIASGNRLMTRMSMSIAPAEQLGPPSRSSGRPSRTAFALSPDGRTLVFSGTIGTTRQLFSRPLDHSTAMPIAGTEGAVGPFFSPDGQWVGFWANNKLKKSPIAGGPSIDICEAHAFDDAALFGASWGANDLIIFSRGRDIAAVPAAGGTPHVVVTADPGKVGAGLAGPQWLPGGNTILYTAIPSTDWTQAEVVTQSINGGDPRSLISGVADARYVPTGHLLYMKLGTLMAVPFDPARLQITGAAVAMIEDVMQAVNMPGGNDETGAGQYVVANDGTLAYLVGGVHPDLRVQLLWVDRRGAESPLKEPPGPIYAPRVSPDDRQLTYFVAGKGSRQSDVWVYDLTRDAPTRLTFAGDNNQPMWSPDARRVIFSSGVPRSLFWTAADGSGAPDRLTTNPLTSSAFGQSASSASSNNLVAVVDGRLDGGQISVLSLEGDRKLQPFLHSPFALTHPAFSDDGAWLAYVSPESGRNEVYVQAFPGRGEKHRISTAGGTSPVWGKGGRELFYMQESSATGVTMMAVDVDTTKLFTAGRARPLFTGRYRVTIPTRGYDVSPDGQRFIMTKPIGEPEKPPSTIDVVLNWTEELKRLVRTTH
jgi:serine/threonine protein kinase/Tol biopolymer transport system component